MHQTYWDRTLCITWPFHCRSLGVTLCCRRMLEVTSCMSTRWFSKVSCICTTCSLQLCSCCCAVSACKQVYTTLQGFSTRDDAGRDGEMNRLRQHHLTSYDFVSSISCSRAISCSARLSKSLSSGFTNASFEPFFFLTAAFGGISGVQGQLS